jgi:hypothetical protein
MVTDATTLDGCDGESDKRERPSSHPDTFDDRVRSQSLYQAVGSLCFRDPPARRRA